MRYDQIRTNYLTKTDQNGPAKSVSKKIPKNDGNRPSLTKIKKK